ncbi:MAG TPA: sulfotransferase [Acetobacteraceae bacterium]|jgi:hypothetical protein|nr:sulfotransferase [Acetobacteraceae bacterium]
MPNAMNVMAPINIFGIGRSGTTLLQNILGTSGFIQTCNETNDFVCGSWRAGELLNPSHDRQAIGDTNAWTTRALHAALCAALPSDKPSWCQKLAGIPKSINWDSLLSDNDLAYAPELPFPYEWYWRAISHAFPHSSDVLILRDYRDVVISRNLLSQWAPKNIGEDIAFHYNLMAHPASRVRHVIRLEDLVAQPESVIFGLCDFLGIQYASSFLKAMDWYAAPSSGRQLEEARAVGFSWNTHYESMVTDEVHAVIDPAHQRLRARFSLGDADAAAAPAERAA